MQITEAGICQIVCVKDFIRLMYIPTNMVPCVVPSHGNIRSDYISEASLSAVPNRQFPQPFVPYFDSLRRLMLRGCSQIVNCKPGSALQIRGVIALMGPLGVTRRSDT